MQKLLNNKLLQFSAEALIIIVATFFAFQFFPTLPWWSVAITAGLVSFALNTKVPSFMTGFTAIALLWGVLAFQLNSGNAEMLAGKIAAMFSVNETIASLGGLNPLRLIYVTAFVGGVVGGLGAMTGNFARKVVSQILDNRNEKEAVIA